MMQKILSLLVRPTMVLLMAGASYLAAQATGIRLFFHLSYILAGLVLLAFAWAAFNLRGITLRREVLTSRANVGEYARERLTIANRWLLPKLWVELRDESDIPQHAPGFVAYIGGGQRTRLVARTLCTRRGRFTLGPSTLISGDPFGIVRLSRRFHQTSEIVVYPQTFDLPHFVLPSAELPGGQEVRSRTFNVTPAVATVREYAPGDSFNRIHWRSTARVGQLMVKEFELDPTADIYIALDMQERAVVRDTRANRRGSEEERDHPWWERTPPQQRSQQNESTEELAVVTAASVTRSLLERNRNVGFVAWGQHHEIIPAERESRQLFKILEALAVLRAQGRHSLAELLVAESRRLSRNSSLIIITSSLDERWPNALQQLLYRGVRAVVIFIDPQSFGGWRDPGPTLSRLAELRVPTYRVAQGDHLPDALRSVEGVELRAAWAGR